MPPELELKCLDEAFAILVPLLHICSSAFINVAGRCACFLDAGVVRLKAQSRSNAAVEQCPGFFHFRGVCSGCYCGLPGKSRSMGFWPWLIWGIRSDGV